MITFVADRIPNFSNVEVHEKLVIEILNASEKRAASLLNGLQNDKFSLHKSFHISQYLFHLLDALLIERSVSFADVASSLSF